MHLLQIIGNQPWPNFLPILALKPDKVTFLASADPQEGFAQSAKAIHQAACELGCPFEFDIIKTDSNAPSIHECSETLKHESPNIINITGGTKPMSIAAYLLAQKNNTPSFYLDTRRINTDAFELTETSTEKITFSPLNELASTISVRLALMAQGFPVPDSFTSPSDIDMQFALTAAHIRQSPSANKEISNYLFELRKQFINPKRNKLYENGKLRKALQIPFSCASDSPQYQYMQAAVKSGLVTPLENGTDFKLTTLDTEQTGSKELRSVTAHHFKLLEGIWFELALFDHLKKQSCYGDICWSVEADSDNTESIGETDLVAFNKDTFSLHFISCKVAGPHGQALDHIQGLRRRATKEGGKFSKAELWIFAPKSEDSKQSLTKHCMEQNVSLHILSEELSK
jgi:hypothetical protein